MHILLRLPPTVISPGHHTPSFYFTYLPPSLPLSTTQGKLKGYDLRANVIMSDCVEREYSLDDGVEMVPLGLYMIKGDNV